MPRSKQPKARSGDDPPSADEDVAKLRLELRRFSLSELVEEGVVNWDKTDRIVSKGPDFDEIWPLVKRDR